MKTRYKITGGILVFLTAAVLSLALVLSHTSDCGPAPAASNAPELMKAGKVTPVIDRSYDLNEVPEAMRYSETGRARGKIIITM